MTVLREIVFDTETTGLFPDEGHRLVEIAAIELIDHVPSSTPPFHVYINPERSMPDEAFKVHGLSEEFLKDKPLFQNVASDFLDFIQDAKMVAHNIDFDMRFLNAELKRFGHETIEKNRWVDTLALARAKFPGSSASLDALCRRFQIDLKQRQLHSALVDTKLLCDVYLELLGGRQKGFSFQSQDSKDSFVQENLQKDSFLRVDPSLYNRRQIRRVLPTDQEKKDHQKFVETKIKKHLWEDFKVN